eukprot:842037-Pleurochrysis_carterae.AAC.1
MQAREVQRNLELDRPNGRALLVDSKHKFKSQRKLKNAVTGAGTKGDPKRVASELKWHEKAGPCRHCGGRHWHRDCPRRKRDTEQRDKSAGNVALATDADATDAAIGEALFSSGSGNHTIEFKAGAGGTALCVRGVPSSSRASRCVDSETDADAAPKDADHLAHEEYLAACELRAQDEREHARLFPASESDSDASQHASLDDRSSGSSGAKARVRYVAFENIWPDRDDLDAPSFEAAVAALNEKCRVLERRKEHLRHDIYLGDDRAREELIALERESIIDPNAEIRRWKLARNATANDVQPSESRDVPAPAAHSPPRRKGLDPMEAPAPDRHNNDPPPDLETQKPANRAPTSSATTPDIDNARTNRQPVAGWALVSLMMNVSLVTTAVVVGVQRIMFDP